MNKNTKVQMLDVMLDVTEAAVLMYDNEDVAKRTTLSADILGLLATMTNEMKDVLLLSFMTHQAGLLLALADLRGESRDEAIAYWRMAVMQVEHARLRVVSDEDPV